MGGLKMPQMDVGGGLMPMNQVDPNTLSPQERFAYNQAMAYMQMRRQGSNPQAALSPDVLSRYSALMGQYFPGQNFFLR